MKMRISPFILALTLTGFAMGAKADSDLNCEALILGLARGMSAPARVIEAIKDRVRPPVTSSQQTISPEALLEIRDVADEILKRFPPNEYAYVGVGRSPSALMAFFKALGLGQIFNVPLTGARGVNFLTDDDRIKLYEHFNYFAPNARRTGLRKVVLIDYVQSGKSSLKALELFRDFYSDGPEKFEVTMFNMIEPIREVRAYDPDEDYGYMMDEVYDPTPLQPQAGIFDYPHFQLVKGPLAELLKSQTADIYGEFGSYRIGARGNGSSVLMISSPSYVNLVRDMKIRIKRELK